MVYIRDQFSAARLTHCANCGAEGPGDKPHQVGECVTASADRPTVGGYKSSSRLVTDLAPPPPTRPIPSAVDQGDE